MESNTAYPCDSRNYTPGRTTPVTYLVVHYVGASGGARDNARYYGSSPVGASAHYFVGHASQGAAIYQSVAEGDTAWHCGATSYRHPACRNANSIGVELCCHQSGDGTWYFDKETVAQGVALCRDIMARHGIPIEHVLRHYDVTGKCCPAPFVHDPAAWGAFLRELEEPEMTKEEIVALAEQAAQAAAPRVYTQMTELPPWGQELVAMALEAGVLRGDGAGRLNLTDTDLKTLSMLRGAGLLGEV